MNLPIPVDLQQKYGRDRLTDAIGTSDPRVAERAVTLAKAKFIEEQSEIEHRGSLAALVDRLPEDRRNLYESAGGIDGLLKAYEDSMLGLKFMQGSIPPHEGEISDLEEEFRNEGFASDERVLTRLARREAKTLNALGQIVAVPGGDFETIEDVANAFVEAKGWTGSAAEAMAYTIRRWKEFHGELPLHELKRRHLAEFAEAAKGLPTSTAKSIRPLPMLAAIAQAHDQNLPTIEHKTRERLVNHLKSVMKWGLNHGKIQLEADPWSGFVIDKPKEAHSSRKARKVAPFKGTEVKMILEHVKAAYNPDLLDYWLPPLAAYTGARREELGQLLVSNVVKIDGIWAMEITDDDPEQKVKNRHSVRTVPVPLKLIDMGFIEFVKSRRAGGGHYLVAREFCLTA